MPTAKRIVLDVLKPHQPNSLEFALRIAEQDSGCRVRLKVEEVDEKTESITLEIEGADVCYDAVAEAITSMGASVHSIDEVEVVGDGHGSGSSQSETACGEDETVA